MLSQSEISRFRRDLLEWFRIQARDLPWRKTRDAYAIWISEIMLQQTRVAAVVPYYERFLARFPDLPSLAAAPEHELLACWAGLGYYYRARNLQRAAQQMVAAGAFPTDYAAIRKLAGVGEYTAAAVASIAFNLPHAVVDGNVFRVLSRIFEDETNIASGRARKHFTALAQSMLHPQLPGTFNQALMELGAVVCLPSKPLCLICPVSTMCRSRANGTQEAFPVKIKPQKKLDEKRTVYWIEAEDKVLLWQRPADSRLMPGFWELPEANLVPGVLPGRVIGSFRHGITVHRYVFELREAKLSAAIGGCQWVGKDQLLTLPLSTVVKKAQTLLKGSTTINSRTGATAPAQGASC
jgi:A/G-specific adenine glycosylase